MLPGPRLLLQRSMQEYWQHRSIYVGYCAWMLLWLIPQMLANLFLGPSAQTIVSLVLMGCEIVALAYIQFILVSRVRHSLVSPTLAWLPPTTQEITQRLPALISVILLVALVTLGGSILFLIPGLLFSVWFFFADIEVILEQKQGLAALSESRALSAGRFFAVFYRVFSVPLLLTLVYNLVYWTIMSPFLLSVQTNWTLEEILFHPPPWLTLTHAIGTILIVSPILFIYSVLLYYSLKSEPTSNQPIQNPEP